MLQFYNTYAYSTFILHYIILAVTVTCRKLHHACFVHYLYIVTLYMR